VLRVFLSLEELRSCSAPGFPPETVDKDRGEGGRTFGEGACNPFEAVVQRGCLAFFSLSNTSCNL
jgi:hypothetical protein